MPSCPRPRDHASRAAVLSRRARRARGTTRGVGERLEAVGRAAMALALAVALLLFARSAAADGRTAFLIDRLKYPPAAGQTDISASGRTPPSPSARPMTTRRSRLCATPSATRATSSAKRRPPHQAPRAPFVGRLLEEPPGDRAERGGQSANWQGDRRAHGGRQRRGERPQGQRGREVLRRALERREQHGAPSSRGIDRVVLGAIRSKLDGLGPYQIAPDKETPADARAQIGKRKLKAFYLSILVDKFDYDGGNLRVRVKVAVFTYPGKDLKGEVPAGLTQQGVSPGDHAAEDNLVSLAAARTVELFAQNFQ